MSATVRWLLSRTTGRAGRRNLRGRSGRSTRKRAGERGPVRRSETSDAHLVVVARRSIDRRGLGPSLEHGDEVSVTPIRAFCESERGGRAKLAAADDEHSRRRSRARHGQRVSITSGYSVAGEPVNGRTSARVGKQRLGVHARVDAVDEGAATSQSTGGCCALSPSRSLDVSSARPIGIADEDGRRGRRGRGPLTPLPFTSCSSVMSLQQGPPPVPPRRIPARPFPPRPGTAPSALAPPPAPPSFPPIIRGRLLADGSEAKSGVLSKGVKWQASGILEEGSKCVSELGVRQGEALTVPQTVFPVRVSESRNL